ncbi:MAG: 8-amino-7-oxononanoate synthase [Pseudohongiellaceae bacterium]
MLDDELQAILDQRKHAHRYRQRLTVEPFLADDLSSQAAVGQTQIMVDGNVYLGFCSNDYLGLARHPALVAALQDCAAKVGVGSTASHLVCGHSYYHHKLELELAAHTGRERALLFSTCYMANLGVVAALAGRGDSVFEDRLNHASLIDAGMLSRAQLKRFRHNDCSHLDDQLTGVKGRKLVVVDGVFSMDGDIAPLPELASVCKAHDAILMVDDAHGFGVLGERGGGCVEHFNLSSSQVPILVGALGKAFGTFGAFVAGSNALIETLIQFARPYIYTTAIPPALAAATSTSLMLLSKESWRRDNLQQRIAQFRAGAKRLGLSMVDSTTPIQPVLLGDDALVLDVAAQLKQSHILVGAIRPPTVPEGTSRLRITFSAVHTSRDVEQLLVALDAAIPLSARALLLVSSKEDATASAASHD